MDSWMDSHMDSHNAMDLAWIHTWIHAWIPDGIVHGFRHGFIHEISRIVSMIGGFIFAHKFYLDIMPFGEPYIQNENVLLIISYLSIFFYYSDCNQFNCKFFDKIF